MVPLHSGRPGPVAPKGSNGEFLVGSTRSGFSGNAGHVMLSGVTVNRGSFGQQRLFRWTTLVGSFRKWRPRSAFGRFRQPLGWLTSHRAFRLFRCRPRLSGPSLSLSIEFRAYVTGLERSAAVMQRLRKLGQ